VSATVPLHRLRDALEPWCAAEVSGALRVLDAPGGSVYLVDGLVAYAECPAIPGLDRLLTASGRIPAEAWRAALAAGRATNKVGAELVSAGLLTSAELESVVLLALHDAAYFLFDALAQVRFEPGAVHPLGTTCAVDLRTLGAEVDRRKQVLVEEWPDATIDTAAVVPVRRLRGQFVALTALQWEVVANADRRRSPVDLARLLGRDSFTLLLEVRRLARAGLVEPGRPGGSVAAESVATVRARAAAPVPVPVPAVAPEPFEVPPADGPLPRREATNGAGTPWELGCSEETLHRIIAGLAALR